MKSNRGSSCNTTLAAAPRLELPHLDTEYLMPRKRRLASGPFRDTPLTSEEFASLKQVGNRPMQRTIPDEHRDRLIEAGYIREVVRHSEGVSALALTGRGIRRLALGK
jgi:hypothetical protein